ncbi:MAG: hypothetical protein U0165_17145 [Polyangiaceae bacterium]
MDEPTQPPRCRKHRCAASSAGRVQGHGRRHEPLTDTSFRSWVAHSLSMTPGNEPNLFNGTYDEYLEKTAASESMRT